MTTKSRRTRTNAHDESVAHARAVRLREGSGGKLVQLGALFLCRLAPPKVSRWLNRSGSIDWQLSDRLCLWLHVVMLQRAVSLREPELT
jgi:hypothetical protein